MSKEKKSLVRGRSVRQYFFAMRELTAREIKRKYARSSLGIIWSVLNPLLTMIVISLVFSKMFNKPIENFPIYYLTGHLIWGCFTGGTNSAMSALVDNRNLLIKSQLPKQVFILSRIYTDLVNFGYTFIAYVLMLFLFGIKPSFTMFLFFVDVILLILFTTGIGYMLATAYVFFADIKHLYSVILTLVMYLSALFYPVDSLPEVMQTVINNNPLYIYIKFARVCVMDSAVPDISIWIKMIVWSMASFVIGLLVFKKKENQIMQKV